MIRRFTGATLAAVALTASPALATMPGANGRLVVQREVGKQFDLFTLNADGSGERVVRRTPRTIEEEPAWSPDGRRLAFASGPADEFAGEIVTTDPFGGALAPSRASARSPALRRGRRTAVGSSFFTVKDFEDFDGLPPGELYSISAKGKRLRRLTEDRQVQTDPFYSPDGKHLVFAQWRAVKNREGVFDIALKISRADGSRVRSLTSISGKRDTFNASWSPDGRRLAFEIASPRPGGRKGGRQSDLAVIRVNGKGERRLTRTRALESNPVWSPDGRQIAFTSDRHDRRSSGEQYNSSFELYVMDADGSDIRRLTDNEVADTRPDWQPLPR